MKDTILIVDDKRVNRFMLHGMFSNQYKILEGENGTSAIQMIEKHKEEISIILLDLIMPESDGFSVLEYMKEKGISGKIPVVLITVSDSDETIGRAYEYEVADCIQKPFQEDAVRKRIERILATYQQKKKAI